MPALPYDELDLLRETEQAAALRLATKPYVSAYLLRLLGDPAPEVRFKGLRLAKRVVRDVDFLLTIFDVELERRDVWEIGVCIKHIAPRIGFKRLINHLTQLVSSDPISISRAWYYMAIEVSKLGRGERDLLASLERRMDEMSAVMPSEEQLAWLRARSSVDY